MAPHCSGFQFLFSPMVQPIQRSEERGRTDDRQSPQLGVSTSCIVPTRKLVACYVTYFVETPRPHPAFPEANPKLYFATVGGTLRKLPTSSTGEARQLCSVGGPWLEAPRRPHHCQRLALHLLMWQDNLSTSKRLRRLEWYWLCSQSCPLGLPYWHTIN